jgi:hypothetical protein
MQKLMIKPNHVYFVLWSLCFFDCFEFGIAHFKFEGFNMEMMKMNSHKKELSDKGYRVTGLFTVGKYKS